MFTAMLVLAGLILAHRERWFVATVCIGFATFKFIGIPFAVVLFGYTIALRDRDAITKTVARGLASQIPNLLYFAVRPEEFVLILKEHGAISIHSNSLSANPYHLTIETLGLGQWYIDTGFSLMVLLCCALGILWAARVRGHTGLLGGFLIGYFATSYLIPAEQRIAPFLVLTIALLLSADRDGIISRQVLLALFLGLIMAQIYPVAFSLNMELIGLVYIDGQVVHWIQDLYPPVCGMWILIRYWMATTATTWQSRSTTPHQD